MKIKKYLEAIHPLGNQNFHYEEEGDDSSIPAQKIKGDNFDAEEGFEDDFDQITEEDILENQLSDLRKMTKNLGFNEFWIFVDNDDCINVQITSNKTEKMRGIMKIMNFFKKLETDTFIQYDSEFDLWETKSGDPLFTAKFFYDEETPGSVSIDDAPF